MTRFPVLALGSQVSRGPTLSHGMHFRTPAKMRYGHLLLGKDMRRPFKFGRMFSACLFCRRATLDATGPHNLWRINTDENV